MIILAIKDVLNAVGGRLTTGSENAHINGASTDSRTINHGELFFALKGPRFDGHQFIDDVFKKGAVAAIVSLEFNPVFNTGQNPKFRIIKVADTLTALGDLARYWREIHPVPLIAVSGSCGKTTTKEMIAAILKASRSIIKTEGNLNNLIGLPLTIFRLNNVHKAAVLELGISEKGEMKKLAHICKPDIAVLTNIAEAHTATLGSIEGVASAKGELFQDMDIHGTAVINIDDPWLAKMENTIHAKKVTFSLKSKADVMLKESSAFDLQPSASEHGISATFIAMGEEIPVKLKYAGMHNLSNAASAIAATFPLGATKQEIIDGLYSTEPAHGRMEVITTKNGITIIDDTYNANPLSMEASLKTLANMKGRKIAVLADMLELGDRAQIAHKKVGNLVQNMGIDFLFVTGNFSKDSIKGATDAGMTTNKIYAAKDKDGLIEILNSIIRNGDNILVKGSRGMKMEEVVASLKKQEARS